MEKLGALRDSSLCLTDTVSLGLSLSLDEVKQFGNWPLCKMSKGWRMHVPNARQREVDNPDAGVYK